MLLLCSLREQQKPILVLAAGELVAGAMMAVLCLPIHWYYSAVFTVWFVGPKLMVLWYHYTEMAAAMDVTGALLVYCAPVIPIVMGMLVQRRSFSRCVSRRE